MKITTQQLLEPRVAMLVYLCRRMGSIMSSLRGAGTALRGAGPELKVHHPRSPRIQSSASKPSPGPLGRAPRDVSVVGRRIPRLPGAKHLEALSQ